jgi:hypothetical protein
MVNIHRNVILHAPDAERNILTDDIAVVSPDDIKPRLWNLFKDFPVD